MDFQRVSHVVAKKASSTACLEVGRMAASMESLKVDKSV